MSGEGQRSEVRTKAPLMTNLSGNVIKDAICSLDNISIDLKKQTLIIFPLVNIDVNNNNNSLRCKPLN